MNNLLLAARGKRQAARIGVWQNGRTTPVHAGGLLTTDFAADSAISGSTTNAGGRTFVSDLIYTRIRQNGYIRQVKASVKTTGDETILQQIKFKAFRPNAENFDFVGESEVFTFLGIGTQTWNLATPIACQPGDCLGFWITKGNSSHIAQIDVKAGGSLRFTNNDIVTSNTFASTFPNTICIEGLTLSPYLAVTGDSIPEGHNVSVPAKWHSFYDLGPDGTRTSEIMNQLRGLIGDGSVLQYQNHAKGSQTFGWVLSTGIVSAIAAGAHTILVHCGVNDVATAREWAAVLSDLDAIKVLVDAANPRPRLLVDEILPWTAGSDAQAAAVRAFNAHLAAWCAGSGVKLVRCHDAMGQVRAATGELDDLLAAYDFDGVHLTQAGVDRMAQIVKRYL